VVRLGDVHEALLDRVERAHVDHLLYRVRPVEHTEVAVPAGRRWKDIAVLGAAGGRATEVTASFQAAQAAL